MRKSLNKKLALNKLTVAGLNEAAATRVLGGETDASWCWTICDTCPTVYFTCPPNDQCNPYTQDPTCQCPSMGPGCVATKDCTLNQQSKCATLCGPICVPLP